MTPDQLLAMAEHVHSHWPSATLEKNRVGNLNVYLGDAWVAWLDLATGAVELVDTNDQETPA